MASQKIALRGSFDEVCSVVAMNGGGGRVPLEKRRFCFIDASNTLLGLYEYLGVSNLRADQPSLEAIEMVRILATWKCQYAEMNRFFYIGSFSGPTDQRERFATALRRPAAEFNGLKLPNRDVSLEPIVKEKATKAGEKGKGVDSSLVLAMLTNAWNGNYDVGVLLSGDTDFSEMVTEVRRHGPQVYGVAFERRSQDPNYRNLFDQWLTLDTQLSSYEKHPDNEVAKLLTRLREGKVTPI